MIMESNQGCSMRPMLASQPYWAMESMEVKISHEAGLLLDFTRLNGIPSHVSQILSHHQDTIHAEKGCAEMYNFCMAALMFLTGDAIKARTLAHVEFPLGASPAPGRLVACGLVLPRPRWCTSSGNVWFLPTCTSMYAIFDVLKDIWS